VTALWQKFTDLLKRLHRMSAPAICVCRVPYRLPTLAGWMRWTHDGGICDLCCGASGVWQSPLDPDVEPDEERVH
jgi:hypothetical protein